MTSKRSGRLFLEDEHHTPQDDTRQSRSKEEMQAVNSTSSSSSSASSRRESRDSSLAPASIELDSVVAQPQSAMKQLSPSSQTDRRSRHPSTLGDIFNVLPTVPTNSTLVRDIPLDGRPLNFGIVVPGVYRCSYPKPEDYTFMQNLGLKTVITLGHKDEPDQVYTDFMAASDIKHHIIGMKGTKKESIPINTMREILRIVLDQNQYPLMIHCNHGKHRTGCVVAVIRMVAGWKLETVLDEYKTYAEPKVRECDVAYISAFELSDLSNLFASEMDPRFRVRNFLRATLFAFVVLTLWTISGSRLSSATASSAQSLR